MLHLRLMLTLLFVTAFGLNNCKAKFHSVGSGGDGKGAENTDDLGTDTNSDDATPSADADPKKITFTANDTEGILTIVPGTNVTLKWTTEGYDSCSIAPITVDGLTGTHDAGPISVDTTYTITCLAGGDPDTKDVVIKMQVAPTGPTADLKVNGQDGPITVNYNSNIAVTWTSQNATNCLLTPSNSTGTSGALAVNNVTASVVYVLSCTGPEGTTSDSVAVNVNTPPGPTADLLVNGVGGPIFINSGTNLTVSWTSTNATSCKVTPGDYTGTSGSKTVNNVTANAQYNLYCEGPGGTVSITTMVYINTSNIEKLDLKANGQDTSVTVAFGSDVNLSWTSENATSCMVITPSTTFNGLNDNKTLSNVRYNQNLLMSCTYPSGNIRYDYVTIIVESAPAPTVVLKANGQDDLLVVLPGDSASLAWNSTNASSCTVTPGNFSGVNGVQTVSNMTQTTVFVAICEGAGGIAVDAVVVHVNTGGDPKTKVPTADLKVNGSDGPIEVAKNSTVTATWSSTDATACNLTPGNATGTAGSKAHTVQKQTIFILVCTGEGGTATDMVTVRTTTGNNDPTPKPTADLKVNSSDGPITVAKGSNLNLQWWSANATECIVNPGFYAGVSGSQIYANAQQTMIFVLHCSGPGGDFIDQVTVNVGGGNMAPVVDLKANDNDGPVDLDLGQNVTTKWTSSFADSCVLVPNGETGLTGNINKGAIGQSTLYTAVCKGIGGVSFDSVMVNVHKPAPTQKSCDIWIVRNGKRGCGPNQYYSWMLWIQDVAPTLANGVSPSAAIQAQKVANGYWGRYDIGACKVNGVQTPMPQTYAYQGFTYNLWTGNVAGSSHCRMWSQTISPIIISFSGARMNLLPPNSGPMFDMTAEGSRSRFSWPDDGTQHMFLVYDMNGNGKIDTGAEMFGNYAPGPDGQVAANGFEALKKYDANRDGQINVQDPIFQRLQLWGDANRNGIAEAGELYRLTQKSIKSISLKYNTGSVRLDVYGNERRETSTVSLVSGKSLIATDYWLVSGEGE